MRLDADELDAVLARHARFYRRIALSAAEGTFAGVETPHLEVLRRRVGDNLRVALETLLTIDPAAAMELAASLNLF